MTKYSLPISAVLVAAGLTWPHLASAQTFKVERYSIGGEGGTDYLTAEPGTGRVFVSRGTHVVVIDLCDRRPDAMLELGFRRAEMVPLLLQRMRVGKMQLTGENADVAACHWPER